MTTTHYRTVSVDGLDVFYHEADSKEALTLLLLHGFPTSGHMFRGLIPLLVDHFHLVAPDLPGFGRKARRPRNTFTYSFEKLAEVIALYVFDYGARRRSGAARSDARLCEQCRALS
jgi:pimeloyl-ACP methyl ester carboxylesterase